ncbi:MAG: tetratricopeptide repeat protein [Acidobacteriota bacterium]
MRPGLTGVAALAGALVCLGCAGRGEEGEAADRLMARAEKAALAGKTAEANEILLKILAAHPRREDALVAHGRLLASEGDIAAAADVYLRLAALRPANGRYALSAGSYLEVAHRYQEAEPLLRRATLLRPDDPDARYRFGLHLDYDGRSQEAIHHLERARELAPRRTDVSLSLAQALDRVARFQEALGVLDQSLAMAADDVNLLYHRGLIRFHAGEPAGAAADLSRALEADPDLAGARYALARALLAAGKEAEGQREMERFAAEEEKGRQRRLAQRWELMTGSEDRVERRRHLEDLVLADPGNAEAHRLLGAAYAREGDYQQALASYERAARLDPDGRLFLKERVRLLVGLDRKAEARALIQDGLKADPGDADWRRLRQMARPAPGPGGP